MKSKMDYEKWAEFVENLPKADVSDGEDSDGSETRLIVLAGNKERNVAVIYSDEVYTHGRYSAVTNPNTAYAFKNISASNSKVIWEAK